MWLGSWPPSATKSTATVRPWSSWQHTSTTTASFHSAEGWQPSAGGARFAATPNYRHEKPALHHTAVCESQSDRAQRSGLGRSRTVLWVEWQRLVGAGRVGSQQGRSDRKTGSARAGPEPLTEEVS